MSPEERQLLQGLFDRMQSQANNPRDREAEQLIADNLRQQPYAPYLLSQTVIVQDQALQAANQRLQQLEQQVQDLQRNPPAQQGGGGFLSGLFGGGASSPPPIPAQRPVWNQGTPQGGGWGGGQASQQGYAPPQQGPWGGAPAQASGGGGFLQGALGAAAGVAGGVLLADSVRSLFGGHNNSLGIASGVPGMGGGETVVNNYYGDQSGADARQDAAQDAGDYGGSNADWQQDADQDQDDAQDAGDYSDDA